MYETHGSKAAIKLVFKRNLSCSISWTEIFEIKVMAGFFFMKGYIRYLDFDPFTFSM